MPIKINDKPEDYGLTDEEWRRLTKVQRYAIRHPDRVKESSKKYRDANKQYMSDRQRKYHLRDNYGITERDYDDMLTNQNGECAICKTDKPTGKWKRFAVDHCHKTGTIRGLLCNECNRGIGLLRDSADLLRLAADYLDQYRSITNNENKERT